jgi:hypothetical protein
MDSTLNTGHWPKIDGATPWKFWKLILFWWFRTTSILVDHETGCIEKLISLACHAYVKRLNWRSYTSCSSIWRWGGLGLWVRLDVRPCNSKLDWSPTRIGCYCWSSMPLKLSLTSCSSFPWFLTIIKSLGSNIFSKSIDKVIWNKHTYKFSCRAWIRFIGTCMSTRKVLVVSKALMYS